MRPVSTARIRARAIRLRCADIDTAFETSSIRGSVIAQPPLGSDGKAVGMILHHRHYRPIPLALADHIGGPNIRHCA